MFILKVDMTWDVVRFSMRNCKFSDLENMTPAFKTNVATKRWENMDCFSSFPRGYLI